MKNPEHIRQLAHERLSEAKILCDNGKYDGAFYLTGYSIELMLKAKICEQLGVDNLFDEACKIHGIREVRKAIKTHDISVLLIFSGLRKKFEIAKSENRVLERINVRLFHDSGHCIWSEQIRYQSVGSQIADNVQELVELLNHEEGLLQWINKS
jgi:HEPN domain-containing protein